jgi:hypothetical protein
VVSGQSAVVRSSWPLALIIIKKRTDTLTTDRATPSFIRDLRDLGYPNLSAFLPATRSPIASAIVASVPNVIARPMTNDCGR